MTTPEVITVIKDILLAIAAVTTATVAVFGLNTWSRELRGKTEFAAAHNLMRVTYRVRDELQYSRSPVIVSSEFPSGYPGQMAATVEQEVEAWRYIYRNRWEPVRDALQALDTHTLEAEALWGGDVKAKIAKLRHCAMSLQVSWEEIINDKRERGENFRADRDFGRKMRSIAHASSDDGENELNRAIGVAVAGIEDHVKPHLRRGQKVILRK